MVGGRGTNVDETNGSITLVPTTVTGDSRDGASCNFSLGEGMECVSDWMDLRSCMHPVVFTIADTEVMRFDTDGEIIIHGKARATSREAFGCFRAWMMYSQGEPSAKMITIAATAGTPNGRITFGGDHIVFRDNGVYLDGKDATPEDVALALIVWILGEVR